LGAVRSVIPVEEAASVTLPDRAPELGLILASIGEAGQRIAAMDGAEGGAGNISVLVAGPLEMHGEFPVTETISLPQPAPDLAGQAVIVTGSGRRLRDIGADPGANLGIVLVAGDGTTGTLHTSRRRRFARLTVEWNTHLAIHNDTVGRTGTRFHAVVHAQPPYLVYLSHIARYRDEAQLNSRLLRWEAETIVNLPEGLGVLPFMLPGSVDLMEANVERMRTHRVTLWAKHGVMARSDVSVARAVDRIEYAETAARYEYLDMVNGEQADGLTTDELRRIVRTFGVTTTLV